MIWDLVWLQVKDTKTKKEWLILKGMDMKKDEDEDEEVSWIRNFLILTTFVVPGKYEKVYVVTEWNFYVYFLMCVL